MKLENRFTVPVPVAQAWEVLLDVERVAPCMPGATLTSRNGDEFEGTVKVKVGPINLTYGGKARFASLDEEARVAVIEASGKETRGTGTARATVTCRLLDAGGTTDVEVDTDLAVTGKPASFGRGVLADVSGKLVDQFAACLAEEILAGTPADPAAEPVFAATAAELGSPPGVSVAGEPGSDAAAARADGGLDGAPAEGPDGKPAGTAPQPGAPQPEASPPGGGQPAAPRPLRVAEPIDLVGTAGMPVLKRVGPVVGVLLLLWLVARRRR